MELPETAEAIGSMAIRAIYKATTKGPGTPGVLRMNEDKLSFVPTDPRSAMKLDVNFWSIKSQKHNIVDASKPTPPPALLKLFKGEGGCYTFEFDNVASRDECREFVARVLDKHEEAIPLISNVPPENTVACSEQLSAEEVERRMKLLREDSELRKLHKHFVVGNILQEYEFWEIRKDLLDDDETTKVSKQMPGLKNAMPDVRPLANGRTNEVARTSEIIHQFFAEKPAVCRAFLDSVPKKIKQVDPTLDIDADAGDNCIHVLDHGADSESSWRTLSQDLNWHAAVVLEGRSSEYIDTMTIAKALARSKTESYGFITDDHEKLVKVARMTEIEDLQVPQNLHYAPLSCKVRYSHGSNDVNKARNCSLSTDDAFHHLVDQVTSIELNKLNCCAAHSNLALKVLSDLNQEISRSRRCNLRNPNENLLGQLPQRTQDELMDHWMVIQELLQHFWSAYPITSAVFKKNFVFQGGIGMDEMIEGPKDQGCNDTDTSEIAGCEGISTAKLEA